MSLRSAHTRKQTLSQKNKQEDWGIQPHGGMLVLHVEDPGFNSWPQTHSTVRVV